MADHAPDRLIGVCGRCAAPLAVAQWHMGWRGRPDIYRARRAGRTELVQRATTVNFANPLDDDPVRRRSRIDRAGEPLSAHDVLTGTCQCGARYRVGARNLARRAVARLKAGSDRFKVPVSRGNVR
jgi:hypothetical protein